jgi:multiple sugar transport system permease protein
MAAASTKRRLASGIGFLLPNLIGFLAFTFLPLLIAIYMAFTNWDLRLHNGRFRNEPLHFVGLDNFIQLFRQPDFWRFLDNTLFLMMGIPFAIAGSLILAMMLNRDLRGGGKRPGVILAVSAVVVAAIAFTVMVGMGATGMTLLLGGLFCGVLVAGSAAGTTLYRTLVYLPAFTSGVATILLWKALFNPRSGPINMALSPLLSMLANAVNVVSPGLVRALSWAIGAIMLGLLWWGLRRLARMRRDADLGAAAAIVPLLLLILPPICAWHWMVGGNSLVFAIVAIILGGAWFLHVFRAGGPRISPREGFGNALMLSTALMTGEFVLMGIAFAIYHLPVMASNGLSPPGWITAYSWAKPSMMIIAFWAAIGSNNMLLYLAGLSGVPQELYEAADLDGASSFQRFWNVTWPQLAPTTFFIVVMSVIGGLQGGFEMAKALTQGGPDGATTTISYFIYTEGFETGRLGYSSAVAWVLFIMVLAVTLFNWKFGGQYVNNE